jgi:hypothetical protein
MLQLVANVPIVFQRSTMTPGNSVRHGCNKIEPRNRRQGARAAVVAAPADQTRQRPPLARRGAFCARPAIKKIESERVILLCCPEAGQTRHRRPCQSPSPVRRQGRHTQAAASRRPGPSRRPTPNSSDSASSSATPVGASGARRVSHRQFICSVCHSP